jgi:hypothetical protein
MKTTTTKWLHGLISAVITGLATSFLSALGITGANTVGVSIPSLSWRQLAVLTIIGGVVGAAAYLKQSPIPPDDPGPQCPTKLPLFLHFIGLGLIGLGLSMNGCATVRDTVIENETKAQEAANWINGNAGLIENGSMVVCTTVIYATNRGEDRDRVIAAVNAVSSNVNALLSNGKTDPESVRSALRIKETWFIPIADSIANLYESSYWKGMKNGYSNCGEALLRAVSAGMRDATGGQR